METKALKYRTKKYPPAHAISFDHSSMNRDELILKYAPLIKYIAHRLAMRLLQESLALVAQGASPCAAVA